MSRPDLKQDFTALQNGLSQLSILAGSATVFQAALVSAQRVLSGLEEAEASAERAYAAKAQAEADRVAFRADAEIAMQRLDAIRADIQAAEIQYGEAMSTLDVEKVKVDVEVYAHRVAETARVDEYVRERVSKADEKAKAIEAAVEALEARRDAAERRIAALKADLSAL